MTRKTYATLLTAVLLLGFALRYWLAFHVFRAQGFAWDLSTFADWMETIRSAGHAAYSVDPSINYPPLFAQLLEILNWLGMRLPGSNAPDIGDGPWLLLKWLPILADLGIAALLAYAGRRWYSEQSGLWAAALYLAIPVTWYDSAIWGQMDSVAALPVLAALVLLADKRPEWAAVCFVAGVLTKPQAALALLVLLPGLIGLIRQRRLPWWRVATTSAAGLIAFAVIVNTWSLQVYASGGLAGTWMLGDVLGLAGQYFATADLFPYMSVNAFNPWALAGEPSLASQFATQDVVWVSDSYRILGASAHTWGLLAFAVVAAFGAWLLMRRPDAQSLLLTAALVFTAFFTLTTRVHERYLVQAFAVLALVWANRWWKRGLLLVLAAANTVNLHAILVGGLRISTDALGQTIPENPYPHQGMPPEFYGLSWPQLPVLNAIGHGPVLFAILVVCLALGVLIAQVALALRDNDASTTLRRIARTR